MDFKWIAIFIIIVNFLHGCSAMKVVTTSPSYSPYLDKEKGIPIHGNFCGQNIPTVEITTATATVEELEKIETIDSIDELCKQHDICYTKYPNDIVRCDEELVLKMRDLQMSDPSCGILARSIIDSFSLYEFTKEYVNSDDPYKNIAVPYAVFLETVYNFSIVYVLGMLEIIRIPIEMTCNTFNDDDNKGVCKSIFPPREYKCI